MSPSQNEQVETLVQYSPTEINSWGDVKTIKPGWVRIPMRDSRGAPARHTYVTGWGGTKKWPKPEKDAVVPASWWNDKLAKRAAKTAAPKRAVADDVKLARELKVPVARLRTAVARSGQEVVSRLLRLRAAADRSLARANAAAAEAAKRRRIEEFAAVVAEWLAFADHDTGLALAAEIAEHAVGNSVSVYHADDLNPPDKAERAARAYIRHNHTDYEFHLEEDRRRGWRERQEYEWDYEVARADAARAVDRFLEARRAR